MIITVVIAFGIVWLVVHCIRSEIHAHRARRKR